MTIENFPARRRTLYAGVGFEAVRAFSARQNRVHVLAGNDKKSTEKNFLSALLSVYNPAHSTRKYLQPVTALQNTNEALENILGKKRADSASQVKQTPDSRGYQPALTETASRPG